MKNQTTGDVESSFLLKVIGSRSFQVHFVFMYILCVWYIIHIVPKTATRDSPFHRRDGFGRPSADKPSLKVDSRGNEKWPVKTCIDWFVPTKLIYQIGYTLRECKGWPPFFAGIYLTSQSVFFQVWCENLIWCADNDLDIVFDDEEDDDDDEEEEEENDDDEEEEEYDDDGWWWVMNMMRYAIFAKRWYAMILSCWDPTGATQLGTSGHSIPG